MTADFLIESESFRTSDAVSFSKVENIGTRKYLTGFCLFLSAYLSITDVLMDRPNVNLQMFNLVRTWSKIVIQILCRAWSFINHKYKYDFF